MSKSSFKGIHALSVTLVTAGSLMVASAGHASENWGESLEQGKKYQSAQQTNPDFGGNGDVLLKYFTKVNQLTSSVQAIYDLERLELEKFHTIPNPSPEDIDQVNKKTLKLRQQKVKLFEAQAQLNLEYDKYDIWSDKMNAVPYDRDKK